MVLWSIKDTLCCNLLPSPSVAAKNTYIWSPKWGYGTEMDQSPLTNMLSHLAQLAEQQHQLQQAQGGVLAKMGHTLAEDPGGPPGARCRGRRRRSWSRPQDPAAEDGGAGRRGGLPGHVLDTQRQFRLRNTPRGGVLRRRCFTSYCGWGSRKRSSLTRAPISCHARWRNSTGC